MKAIKNVVVAAIFVAAAAGVSSARAQDVSADTGGLGLTVGAYMSMGMGHAIYSDDDVDPKPRFAGGFAAYVDWYLSDIFALEAGLGFLGKGARYEDDDFDLEAKLRAVYMEIPIGAKLNISGFQAALLLAPAFGVGGEYKYEVDGDSDSEDIDFGDSGEPKVFNLGLKVVLGYAIPVWRLFIVPGLSFNMDLLNEFDEDDLDDESARWWNLMFHIGAEFGF
jgi:hypothetical protein